MRKRTKKKIIKIVWTILVVVIIFSMVAWTIGLALM